MSKWLRRLFARSHASNSVLELENGFSGYEWLTEFKQYMADPEIARLLKVELHKVQGQGGDLDPGFCMSLLEPQRRLWFLLMVCFSVQGNREALLTLAEWAPTDSAKLWCRNPPSCSSCGSVLPHHSENCPLRPDLILEIDEY